MPETRTKSATQMRPLASTQDVRTTSMAEYKQKMEAKVQSTGTVDIFYLISYLTRY